MLTVLYCVNWRSVENENHCDFVRLREMLVRTNMEDLRETTHYRHYELYRRCKLQEMGFSDDESMRCLDKICLQQNEIILTANRQKYNYFVLTQIRVGVWSGLCSTVSRKWCEIELRSQLITNRKSYGLSIWTEVDDLEWWTCMHIVTGNQKK